jgi:hypothetical protein
VYYYATDEVSLESFYSLFYILFWRLDAVDCRVLVTNLLFVLLFSKYRATGMQTEGACGPCVDSLCPQTEEEKMRRAIERQQRTVRRQPNQT